MNKELKNRIASEYENITPNRLDAIKEECARVQQLESEFDMIKSIQQPSAKIKYLRMAAYVAVLVFVSAISLTIGRSIAHNNIETVDVPEEQISGNQQEYNNISQIEINVADGINVSVDEKLVVTKIQSKDEKLQEKIDALDLTGKDLKAVLDILFSLVNEEDSVGDNNKDNEVFADPASRVEDEIKAKDSNNNQTNEKSTIETGEKHENATDSVVDMSGNLIKDTIDTTTDIAKDSVDFTTDIAKESIDMATEVVDEVFDTGIEMVEDVTDTVKKIKHLF